MQFPRLQMDSSFAKLGLDIKKPIQSIEQPKATLLIKQPPAEMIIKRRAPKLTIDQTKAWEDVDLKHIFKRIEEFAQNGYQDWLDGMARRSRQGDEMMAIHKGGNPIVSQAISNSRQELFQFQIGWIPSLFSVKTNYDPGDLSIDWKVNDPEIQAIPQKPRINYQPGEVNGYMKQWHSLKVDVVGLEVNERI